ncbi:MAG: hypothetical protein JO364_15165 [Pseudonocardiales bacterium]|nr:hypothetical protein [Pseudonocardiales bacterium]MBV9031611.1 hypothetical protein [Pseudonocardiales bacterium]
MAPPARRYRRVPGTARTATLAFVALLAVVVGADPPAPAQAQDSAPEDSAPDRTDTWFARLTPTEGDTNVRLDAGGLRLGSSPAGPASIRSGRPEGMLLTAAHPLAALSSRVAAQLAADQPAGSAVDVDVRGTRGDGSWTEWVAAGLKAPAMLGAAVTSVQARISLRGGRGGVTPLVRSVRLTAQPGVALLAARPRTPPSYRVFATREGLVRARTANGHVINERDHFVALPSRRGLSPLGSGDYTVKVCADNDRCEWAPVWDVGPWNTTDDYWNPAGIRQSWADLPRGRPQAQAAYEDGYHDGLDQFSREVLNPAGIDLADGTFWDGLGLRDNSWVTVTYLWADGAPPAIVRIPILPVRSGPGNQYPAVGLAAQRAELLVECTVAGQLVTDGRNRTDRWLRIGPKQFISAAYVSVQGVPGARQGVHHQAPGTRCAAP